MIIVWGFRCYGLVERVYDEYATTKFFHIFWLPLVPIQSYWISRSGSTEIPPHGRSILAGYARVWSIVAALIAIGVRGDTSSLSLLALPPLAYLAYRSWRARDATDLETKRAAFHRAAYAIACDPKRLPSALLEQVRATTNAAWPDAGAGRTPHDTAELGARTGREAACAYMMLRLAEQKLRGADAIDHARAADRIVLGQQEPTTLDGPYRGIVEHAPTAGAPIGMPAVAAAVVPPPAPPRRFVMPRVVLTLCMLACSLIGGGMVVVANAPPSRLTERDFTDRNALVDRGRVELACDRIVDDRPGTAGERIASCETGRFHVFVAYLEFPTSPIRGRIVSMRWPRFDGVFVKEEDRAQPFVLSAETDTGRHAMTGVGIALLLALPGLLAFRRFSEKRRSRSQRPA